MYELCTSNWSFYNLCAIQCQLYKWSAPVRNALRQTPPVTEPHSPLLPPYPSIRARFRWKVGHPDSICLLGDLLHYEPAVMRMNAFLRGNQARDPLPSFGSGCHCVSGVLQEPSSVSYPLKLQRGGEYIKLCPGALNTITEKLFISSINDTIAADPAHGGLLLTITAAEGATSIS